MRSITHVDRFRIPNPNPIVSLDEFIGFRVDYNIVDGSDLDLTMQDLSEVAEWASDEDEPVPSDLAMNNATFVAEEIFLSWPQRFDVYPLNGDVVIDSEAIGSDFVMVLCKSDGGITTLVNAGGGRLRKDYVAGNSKSDLMGLISFTCDYLSKLSGTRGKNNTSEYYGSNSSDRNYWKGNIFLKRKNSQTVQTEQVANQSLRSTGAYTHLG